MKLLLVGNGGREHALARTIASTSDSVHLYVQAGNPGLDALGESQVFDPLNPSQVASVAQTVGADLVVIGPEAPLAAGVADAVRNAKIACFGPGKKAARLESSKAFAKEIMETAGVPTAHARACRTISEVDAALDHFGSPYVVKEDGLAAGKGVVVTEDRDAARDHARMCLARPGGAVVIEEYLDGPEVSLFCVCDGKHVVPLMPAQDFKRLGDGNIGPNTGGMGSYTPLPWLTENSIVDEVVATVAQPTIDEMAHRGTPFSGLLYCGLALTSRGLRVVEFNVRFGDPETQVILERLESSLADLLYAAATESLSDLPALRWSKDAVVSVVMASAGYPASSESGVAITGLDAAEALEGVHVIHAGTRALDNGHSRQIVTAGGRVLNVIGRGRDIDHARATAYKGVAAIHFDGAQYRHDIATWPAGLTE